MTINVTSQLKAHEAYLRQLNIESRDLDNVEAMTHIIRFLYNYYYRDDLLTQDFLHRIGILKCAAKLLECGFFEKSVECLLAIFQEEDFNFPYYANLESALADKLELANLIIKITCPQFSNLRHLYQELWYSESLLEV